MVWLEMVKYGFHYSERVAVVRLENLGLRLAQPSKALIGTWAELGNISYLIILIFTE